MADEKLDLTSEDLADDATSAKDAVDVAKDNVFDQVEETVEDVVEAEETIEDVVEDVADDVYDELDEAEERHTSLSSRILTWLVLLVAGAGIALWGGPKLAPNLPAWAAPVARILTPGGDQARQEVAALREEVSQKLASIPAPVNEEALATAAQSAAETGDAALAERLDVLDEQLAELSQTEVIGRLSTLESRFEGVSAEISSLNKTLSEAITTGGDMSAETLAQLAAKDSVIEGLRAEMDTMAAQLGVLSQRVEEVNEEAEARMDEILAEAKSAELQAEEIARQTAILDAQSTLLAAAQSGRGFEAELAALAALNDAAVPEIVNNNAGSGLPSLAVLEEDFTQASHLAIRASIKSEAGDGTLSKVSAFLQSQVATRSLAPQDGEDTDAVLSRMGAALSAGDMSLVLEEANALSENARAPLSAFLEKVELRHSVLAAIENLSAQAS